MSTQAQSSLILGNGIHYATPVISSTKTSELEVVRCVLRMMQGFSSSLFYFSELDIQARTRRAPSPDLIYFYFAIHEGKGGQTNRLVARRWFFKACLLCCCVAVLRGVWIHWPNFFRGLRVEGGDHSRKEANVLIRVVGQLNNRNTSTGEKLKSEVRKGT